MKRANCHPRGLTMVELSVSLALLSGLMLAVVSWLQASVRSSAQLTAPLEWRNAAERVLALIHDDLYIGDQAPTSDGSLEPLPRVVLDGSDLLIRTRNEGSATHRFTHDESQHELSLELLADGSPRRTRLVLQEVRSWSCLIEPVEPAEPAQDRPPPMLNITIRHPDGTTIGRVFRLQEFAG